MTSRSPVSRRNRRASFLLLGSALLGTFGALCACEGELGSKGICAESPGALYERRIAPLFAADHPETCGQCHAGGIKLTDLLRKDACESMACLRAEGLVDLEHPEASVLLAWIDRAKPDSELITADVIAEEREAFLSWISHEAECGACSEAVCGDKEGSTCDAKGDLLAPYNQENDPGDCERETMEKLFRGTVYDWRSRCSPCHFQEETLADETAPRFFSRTGDCRVASLSSLQRIIEFGYIDVEEPANSLLILKPLAEFQGGLPHGGHDKFVKDSDGGYAAFLYFLERYAACETGTVFDGAGSEGAGGNAAK